jgi:hypothetical protein
MAGLAVDPSVSADIASTSPQFQWQECPEIYFAFWCRSYELDVRSKEDDLPPVPAFMASAIRTLYRRWNHEQGFITLSRKDNRKDGHKRSALRSIIIQKEPLPE